MHTKLMLYVQADTNDADYVTTFVEIKHEDLPLIERVTTVLKANHGKWCTSEYSRDECPEDMYADQLSLDDIQTFAESYVPYGECGVHTIDKVIVYDIAGEETLLGNPN